METTDILSEIIASKRREIAAQKTYVPESMLTAQLEYHAPCISMKNRLMQSDTGIIAEFKRRSPSKGWINKEADACVIPAGYEQAGAAALSILTDEPYFGGSLKDLRKARPMTSIPILRKDFIVDPYQLYQAKILGADVVLLIAAALTHTECQELALEAHRLDMEVLLEIHSERELDYVNKYVDMVGVNNRNLGTFHTDVANSFRLASQLPQDMVLVSESGISSPDTIKELRRAGFRGFLMGETFMKTDDPAGTLAQFIQSVRS